MSFFLCWDVIHIGFHWNKAPPHTWRIWQCWKIAGCTSISFDFRKSMRLKVWSFIFFQCLAAAHRIWENVWWMSKGSKILMVKRLIFHTKVSKNDWWLLSLRKEKTLKSSAAVLWQPVCFLCLSFCQPLCFEIYFFVCFSPFSASLYANIPVFLPPCLSNHHVSIFVPVNL